MIFLQKFFRARGVLDGLPDGSSVNEGCWGEEGGGRWLSPPLSACKAVVLAEVLRKLNQGETRVRVDPMSSNVLADIKSLLFFSECGGHAAAPFSGQRPRLIRRPPAPGSLCPFFPVNLVG